MVNVWKALPSGNAIDLLNPSEYTFTITEVDDLLSKVRRFNGYGISVAQHSVMVADTILKITGNPYLALMGLLHDSAEAYIGDISTPVKQVLGEDIDRLETSIRSAITQQLFPQANYLIAGYEVIVKWVDMMALRYELNDLIADGRYQDNEHWRNVQKVSITKYMAYRYKTFGAYYYRLLDLIEEDAKFEQVELTFLNDVVVKLFCKENEHKFEDLY